MFGEVSIAASLMGKLYDLTQSTKKSDATAVQGSDEFASLIGNSGINIASVPTTAASSDSTSSDSLSAATTDGLDSATSDALDYLKDMTSGGLEGAMRAAMKKMRDKVMADMGVTDDSLKAMDPKARAAVEASITKEVEKRMQEAMGVSADGSVDKDKMADFGTKLIQASKAYQGQSSASEMLGQLLGA